MADDLNQLDDETFRRTVRVWIEANYPPHLRHRPHRLHWSDVKEWYFALSKQGWIAPGWPREWGGMGLSAIKQLIFIEELDRWGCSRAPDHGIIMVGPLLIRHGSDEQKRRFLPKIVSGEHIWCQGYSEPNAGSDLANIQAPAVRDGDDYIVNGSKIWTTLAMDANWIFMLVRTAKTGKRQDGISFLLVDLKSPGISIRPILNLAGHDEFAQVFFDDVRVPVANRVGEENRGWAIAKALLGFERLFIGSPKMPSYLLRRLKVMAERMGCFDDPVFLDKYTKLRLDVADLAALFETFVDQVRRGQDLGADVSMLKVFSTETSQRISDLLVETAAEHGAMIGPQDFAGEAIDPVTLFLNVRPHTIYGGSNEIQRGILAKNVLRLPG
jgi:alkylation response protein AidB-like acyl-CoA dehydrogenase